MTPKDDVRLDQIITTMSVLVLEQKRQRAALEKVLARLEVIEKARAIPKFYTHAQMCARLGISSATGYTHRDDLPQPVMTNPLRYAVEEVEAHAQRRREKIKRAS